MSTTTNLGLFKHDNVSTNENSFDIEKALNENFDKIDEAQGRNNSRLQTLENDNTTNKQDIANIKTKNTEQDTYIEELEAETERLRKDLDALPSAEASGEYIHVEDSAESRFKSFKIGGNSKQETREGYNLANYKNSATKSDINFEIGDVESGKTYTLYLNIQGTISFNLKYNSYNNDTNIAQNYNTTGQYIKTFEASESGILYMNEFSWTNYNGISEIMLLEGTYTKDNLPVYEAYGATPSLEFPSEVQAAKDSANVTIQNENYYDKSKAYADGANKQNIMIDKIQGLEVGENYTAYANGRGWLFLKEYDKEGNVIATYGGNTASNKFVNLTKSSNDSRISMQFYSNGDNVDISTYDFTNVMVVKGTYTNASQLPTYVPHKSKTFTIPVQQEMLEGDCFDSKNKKEYHITSKIVLNGTENLVWSNESTDYVGIVLDCKVNSQGILFCDKLKAKELSEINGVDITGIALRSNNNGFYMRLKKEWLPTSDMAGVKSFLAENNMTIHYTALTPTELELTSEQKAVLDEIEKTAQSYKNITNIYSTNELSPIFEVEYRKDIETMIEIKEGSTSEIYALTNSEINDIVGGV